MEETARKPLGGFVFISAMALIATWWAYKRRFIDYRDLRVWLACHELVAKRCGAQAGRVPRFSQSEAHHLVGGVGGEHVRKSLARLERAGLLTWSESSIRFLANPSDVRVGDQLDLTCAIESVTNHRRKIPVPRRLLRFLAQSRRPVLAATALGHLLRCMYYRNGQCSPTGLVKASWIASVFEVDERNVKAARRELALVRDDRPGLLIPGHASQRVLNRYGMPMCLNLQWEPPSPMRRSPPLKRLSTTDSPPLRETGNSSSRRSENQKPGEPGPAGVRKRTGRGPELRHVLDIDLRDPKRLCVLHSQARNAGLVGGSEADILKVFAAAEHAKERGTQNACGLFVTILRKGLWHHVTLRVEDAARRALQLLQVEVVRSTPHSAPESRGKGARMPVRSTPLGDEDPLTVRRRIAASLAGLVPEKGPMSLPLVGTTGFNA